MISNPSVSSESNYLMTYTNLTSCKLFYSNWVSKYIKKGIISYICIWCGYCGISEMLSHGKINDRKELYSNYVLIITVSMYCLTLIYIVVQVPNVVDLRRGVYNYIYLYEWALN